VGAGPNKRGSLIDRIFSTAALSIVYPVWDNRNILIHNAMEILSDKKLKGNFMDCTCLQQTKAQTRSTSNPIKINLVQRLTKFVFKGVVLTIVLVVVILISGCAASPLHMAAERNDVSQVKSLLAEGVNINIRDDDGATPLHLAARAGHLKVVELLLANGAAVNAKNRYSSTPLHWSVYSNHIDVVKLLLSKGADVNARSRSFVTPLFLAVWNGNAEMVKLLIAHGADVNAKDNESFTPLHIAAMSGRQGIVESFPAEGANVNVKEYEVGLTSLFLPTQEDRIETMKLLLASGADVNAKNKFGYTPLHIASYHGQIRATELLLASGANVSVRDNSGQTPLDIATVYKRTEIADILIKSGAKRDKAIIFPFADCSGVPGSGKAFTNVLYGALLEKLKERYDVVDILVVEEELLKQGTEMPGHGKAAVEDEIAKRLGANLIIAGELTIWKDGSLFSMPVVGFTVRGRATGTSTIQWSISHSDSVWEAAGERRTAEIAAHEVIEKAIKEGKI
jgi:ankyrin repeat protein